MLLDKLGVSGLGLEAAGGVVADSVLEDSGMVTFGASAVSSSTRIPCVVWFSLSANTVSMGLLTGEPSHCLDSELFCFLCGAFAMSQRAIFSREPKFALIP